MKVKIKKIIAIILCSCMFENVFTTVGTIVVKAENKEYEETVKTLSGNDEETIKTLSGNDEEAISVLENSLPENENIDLYCENSVDPLEMDLYKIYFDRTEKAFVIEDIQSLLAFQALINGDQVVEVYDEQGLIEDQEVLGTLGENAYMTTDIDLQKENINQWKPIGKSIDKPYSGIFDGKGHKVCNISSYMISSGSVGFFAYVKGAKIFNLTVEMNEDISSEVYGVTYGAMLVGYAIDSQIEACYAYGKIFGEEKGKYEALEYAGLICGRGDNTKIKKCIGEGELYARQATGYLGGRNSFAGGVVGYNYKGEIEDCLAFGDISAKGFRGYAGGICGYNDNGTIIRTYYVGNAENVVYSNDGKNEDNYFRSLPADMNKENTMKSRSTYVNWDFENVWEQTAEINDGYPYLKEVMLPQGKTKYVHPSICAYSIKTDSTLIYPQLVLNITFDREINCNKELGISLENIDTRIKIPCNYECNGNSLNIVSNMLEYGKKYTLKINQSTIYDKEHISNYFGGTYNEYKISVAEHLVDGKGTKENPYLISSAGGLAYMKYELGSHYKLNSDIDMSTYGNGKWSAIGGGGGAFTGVLDGAGYTIYGIKMIESSNHYIGLFAKTQNAEIRNLKVCLADNGILDYSVQNFGGFSSVEYPYVGILVGSGSGIIEKCYVEGSIASNQKTYGAGLIAGKFEGTISQCGGKGQKVYAGDSELTFAYSTAGGLVGKLKGEMKDSYCMVDTINAEARSGAGTTAFAGGLIGEAEESKISNCYVYDSNIKSSISSESTGRMGAIVGYTDNETIIERCYFNTDVLSLSEKRNGIALTTEQMKNQDSYEYWDFENVWRILPQWNEGYPFLLWMGHNGVVKYYTDSDCSEQIKGNIDVWVQYGTAEVEALKQLPETIYMCIEEGNTRLVTSAELQWKFTDTYNGKPGMGGSVIKACADINYANDDITKGYEDYLMPMQASIHVEEYGYQELLNKYGMYYEDLFQTCPQALAEAYSYDSEINRYVNLSLDAMKSLSKVDTISAALLMGLNSKEALNFVAKEFLYNNGIMVSENAYERYMDEVVMSIMQECFSTDTKSLEALEKFSTNLKSAHTINKVSQYAEDAIGIFTKKPVIKNLIKGLQDSQKTADAVAQYAQKGIDEEIFFLTVVEMYTINFMQIEEMKAVAINAGNKELYFTLVRMQDKMIDNPVMYTYEHLITDQILSMMIDETMSLVTSPTSGIKVIYKVYNIAYKAVNYGYKYMKPDVDKTIKVIIADNMFQTCNSLVDHYQTNFMKSKVASESITQNEIDEYEMAYKMMLASLKVWMNTAADLYGELGIKELEWLTEENSAKKKELQKLADTILKDGEIDYQNYIDDCMKAAVTYSDKKTVSTPTFIVKETGLGMREVDIACDEPDVTIYYTLDGTIPTSKKGYYEQYNCWIYADSISVAPGQMLKARAYKEGMVVSDVTTYMISEDEYWKQIEKNIETKKNANINLKGYTHYDIPGSLMKRFIENNLNAEIEYDDYSWIINSKDISVIKDVSLKVDKKYFKDVVNDALYEDGINWNVKSVGLHLAYDGILGFEGVLKYYMGIKYYGKIARLYYYNDKTGKYDSSYQQTVIDENGYAKFKFQHASDYLIIYDISEEDSNNSDVYDSNISEIVELDGNIGVTVTYETKSEQNNYNSTKDVGDGRKVSATVQNEEGENVKLEDDIQRKDDEKSVMNEYYEADAEQKDDIHNSLSIWIIFTGIAVIGCATAIAKKKKH